MHPPTYALWVMRIKRRRRRRGNKEKKILIKGEQDKEKQNEKQKEGTANPCLMAYNDGVNNEIPFKFSFDELYETFNDLMDEYKKIGLKNKELKKSNMLLAEGKNKILMEKEKLLKKKSIS